MEHQVLYRIGRNAPARRKQAAKTTEGGSIA